MPTSPDEWRPPLLRFISLLFYAVLVVLIGLFSWTNQQPVDLGLWPMTYTVTMPIYTLVLGAILVAFILGCLASWMGGGHVRRLARRRGREVQHLRNELARLEAAKSKIEDAMTRVTESERVRAAVEGASAAALRELPAPGAAAGRHRSRSASAA